VGSNCFRLAKAPYELKQSSGRWFKNVDSHLKQFNFMSLPNDPCLYYRLYQEAESNLLQISLYVDDLVIVGKVDADALENVKSIMLGRYKTRNLGRVNRILGCEVLCDEATGYYSINQRRYVIV